jgi:hypothetical protein
MKLFDEFITEELRDHIEPTRKGRARGGPIGFPRVKVVAAVLLTISGRAENSIAAELGISDSLIRKWFHEEAFKDRMLQTKRDFTRFLERTLREDRDLYFDPREEVLMPWVVEHMRSIFDKFLTEPVQPSALRNCIRFMRAEQAYKQKVSKWALKRVPQEDK